MVGRCEAKIIIEQILFYSSHANLELRQEKHLKGEDKNLGLFEKINHRGGDFVLRADVEMFEAETLHYIQCAVINHWHL